MSGAVWSRLRVWDAGRLLLEVIVLAVAIWAFVEALSFRPRAAYFPLAASGIVVAGTTVQLTIDLASLAKGRPVVRQGMDVESTVRDLGGRGLLLALRYLGWFVGFIVALNAVGVFVAAMVFVAAFVTVEARWRWWKAAIVTAAVPVAVYLMLGRLELQAPPAYYEFGYALID